MKEALTVSQLNRYIKELVAEDTILSRVLVKGEISGLKESRGNYYFTLKDELSSIQCIVFTNYSGSTVDISSLNDGVETLIEGKVAVYEKSGSYAIYVTKATNIGLGEYFIKLEELKKELKEKGMFDSAYKKDIPKYASSIGVVTAKNGAAIKDIYKTIKDRNPYADVYLYPSLVQGDSAYQSIIDGIMALDNMNLDVIIVGRGGGSIEDLYVYNDVRVAYAIFNARTPIISAVGHEINDSISDLVADVRAATPTAAGVLATYDYNEFVSDLENYRYTLDDVVTRKIDDTKEKISSIRSSIKYLAPKAKLDRLKELKVSKEDSINYLIKMKVENAHRILENYIEKLSKRNALDKMSRGFGFVRDKNKKKLISISKVKKGENIYITLTDGTIESKVMNTFKDR